MWAFVAAIVLYIIAVLPTESKIALGFLAFGFVLYWSTLTEEIVE